MSRAHAFLSASGASRWMNCPPSAKLSEQYEDKSSEYAEQGTDAHTLGEWKLLKALGMTAMDDPRPNLRYFDPEMDERTDEYAAYVLDLLSEVKLTCPDPLVLVEQRVDFSRWVEDAFGTADALIVADNHLYVIDLKYGQGVEVYAEKNPQMSCYALGALNLFDMLYDIENITMTVFQPRRENISSWTISRENLLDWAENTLRPAAELAVKGDGAYSCGSWCQFCKARYECRARAQTQMALLKYDLSLPPTLTSEDIECILGHVDQLVSWAEDIKEYALQAAISGKRWNGYKLVEGRSTRRYTNESAVATAVLDAGEDPYEKKLLGITAMTRLLGKNRFNEILGDLVEKPRGKATLVPESDKRPELENTYFDEEGE